MLPKTTQGKWAGIISIAFIILIALNALVSFPIPSFFLSTVELIGFAAGIIAFILKDLTILVFLSILVGHVVIWGIALPDSPFPTR